MGFLHTVLRVAARRNVVLDKDVGLLVEGVCELEVGKGLVVCVGVYRVLCREHRALSLRKPVQILYLTAEQSVEL